ncbi:ScbR family autoregulator-binding transcription factor [Actinomycetospora sp. TBRC 11914]|uniref:ScbR family autoregulator-binding transcription factor n=1 Tax=Actinomycetospora sp. TBRC 11914 TaxID=2729387 RepID=UPI00200707FB|nr:ScbR family autoregulator-binding transcription factor [Actinomycetospora sp. TBRC 11914]
MVQVPESPASSRPALPGRGSPVVRTRAGSRQARALATRETILDAAAHEFAAEGYHAASLSGILARSGVTKGAMYFHFASKEAMARAVADVMKARLPEVVGEWSAGDDPLTIAVHVAVGYAALLRDEVACRAGLRVVNDGALGPDQARWPADFWEAVHVDLLGRARDAGSLRPGIDPVELARLVVALGTGVRAVCLAAGELAALRERTAASWTVLLHGVAEPSWLARWDAAGGMATVPGDPGQRPGGGT